MDNDMLITIKLLHKEIISPLPFVRYMLLSFYTNFYLNLISLLIHYQKAELTVIFLPLEIKFLRTKFMSLTISRTSSLTLTL